MGELLRGVQYDRDVEEAYATDAGCPHPHFYVAIDDGKYLEKCVQCDRPKVVAAAL